MAVWYRFKAGDISSADMIKKTRPIRNAMKRCLKQYMHSGERCVLTLANNSYAKPPATPGRVEKAML